ncbi:MAG: DUF2252 family protein [Fimbriiglobus sp.]
MTSFPEARDHYDTWLASFGELDEADRLLKRKKIQKDPFTFLRGTYFRWTHYWAEPGHAWEAPVVPSVGDIHVENYGIWRDAEGRLCWGINDFDEADDLPYTHDLIRLATSIRFATKGDMPGKFKPACAAILAGYREVLEAGGDPYVLEERHPDLREIATMKTDSPAQFWAELESLTSEREPKLPKTARQALSQGWPIADAEPIIRFRHGVGVGSLGKARYVGLLRYAGAWMAREVKRLVPPATAWLAEDKKPSQLLRVLAGAKRSPDPFYSVLNGWTIRRIGPKCNRIELKSLTTTEETQALFHAMGGELANVHLAGNNSPEILADLSGREETWLAEAAKTFAALVEADFEVNAK